MKTITKINSPPDVKLEREKTNRALADKGWGPTLRLKVLRTPVAPGVLLIIGTLKHAEILQMFQDFI